MRYVSSSNISIAVLWSNCPLAVVIRERMRNVAVYFLFPPGELQNKFLGLRTKWLKAVTPHLMPIKGLLLTEKTS